MDFTDYADLTIRLGPDLVNSLGSISGNEYLAGPADLRRFLSEHGITAPRSISEEDLAEVRRLRKEVREIFESPNAQTAAERINRLIAGAGTLPFLTDHDGTWHLHYTSTDAPVVDRLGAVVGMGLAEVLARYGWERFGICAAENCRDAFIDTSKNRSRRFCNETCSNRANVAAYRARQRT